MYATCHAAINEGAGFFVFDRYTYMGLLWMERVFAALLMVIIYSIFCIFFALKTGNDFQTFIYDSSRLLLIS